MMSGLQRHTTSALNKSFQKVSFGIRGTLVMPGEVCSNGHGAINACDNVLLSLGVCASVSLIATVDSRF